MKSTQENTLKKSSNSTTKKQSQKARCETSNNNKKVLIADEDAAEDKGKKLKLKQTQKEENLQLGMPNNGIVMGDGIFTMDDPMESGLSSSQKIKAVSQNLWKIGNAFLVLSDQLGKSETRWNIQVIVGLHHTLPYYAKLMPQVVKKQIEVARHSLPMGVLGLNEDMMNQVIFKPEKVSRKKYEKTKAHN